MKIAGKIISAIITVVVLVIVGYYIFEYVRFSNGEEQYYCKEKNTYIYSDGTAEECVGFVYKRIEYTRSGKVEKMYGPFWVKIDEGYLEKK